MGWVQDSYSFGMPLRVFFLSGHLIRQHLGTNLWPKTEEEVHKAVEQYRQVISALMLDVSKEATPIRLYLNTTKDGITLWLMHSSFPLVSELMVFTEEVVMDSRHAR